MNTPLPIPPDANRGSFRSVLRSRWRFVLTAALLLAALTTWVVESVDVADRSRFGPAAQARVVRNALDRIEKDFRRTENELLSRARSLAREEDVVSALRRVRSGDRSAEEGIVRFLSDMTLPSHDGVEIYDQQPRLIGWAGTSIPIDSGPSESGFLERPILTVAFDGREVVGLVVWAPVRDGLDTIGAVRIVRLLLKHVPVRNQYLRNYTIDEEWARAVGLPVRVQFTGYTSETDSEEPYSRLLQGGSGSVFGRVFVTPPTPAKLRRVRVDQYRNWITFFLSAALVLFLWILGSWCLIVPDASGRRRRTIWRLLVFLTVLATVRFLFLAMGVPQLWQVGKAPLAPLFDPQHLASSFGYGAFQSIGDLFLTALASVVAAVVIVRATEPYRIRALAAFASPENGFHRKTPVLRFVVTFAVHGTAVLGLFSLLAMASQRVVLDSTLDFFERSGLLPARLVLIVFAALLLLTFSTVFIASRLLWICMELLAPDHYPFSNRWTIPALVLFSISPAVAAAYLIPGFQDLIVLPVTIFFLIVVYLNAIYSPMRSDRIAEWLQLRSVIPTVVLVSLMLYPVLEKGLSKQRRLQMETAAESFDEDMDSRLLFAIRKVLDRAEAADLTGAETPGASIESPDSLAREYARGELISSLGTHDITITLLGEDGEPEGRFLEVRRRWSSQLLDEMDRDDFILLRSMYREQGDTGVLIEKMTGRAESERFVYVGFSPIVRDGKRRGWLLVRAEPREQVQEGMRPFPRVLIPTGYYTDQFASMSLAEFQNGLLIRSYGRSFGRYNLDPSIVQQVQAGEPIWKTSRAGDRAFVTLYLLSSRTTGNSESTNAALGSHSRIIAVRLPAINFFDHLYYLFRIMMAGLIIGLPVYVLGLWWRYRIGMLPARRVHFRDKVLNAFFVVGTVTVAAMGWVGLQVVTGENEQAVESWLRQHLERVEDALRVDMRGDELPYRVLERIDLDSLSVRVGLDLNVYRGMELERSSRPLFIRERLIEPRLPIQAYEALFFDGFRFVSVDQHVGDFSYTAGFRALVDEQGTPRYVVSLPTLPEQERIEEERARTVAYLFGALLLLVLVVLVTAALLANALTRPIVRLRGGLQAVSEGRFETIGPVRTRDEIGDLVNTFNSMQQQLFESREKLAQQERQLAWREMARQVAHEIKNPLTPMKLSIQHLRRAFDRSKEVLKSPGGTGKSSFEAGFKRTTQTLIEQIDALARIADEFSSLGRMPQYIHAPIDLNVCIRDSATLMRMESSAHIKLDLSEYTLTVDGDREALTRVFINLIKNAFQAIPSGREGLITIVSVRKEADDGRDLAQVDIEDNGAGIPEDVRDRIFVPNFSTKTSGTGLGLAIVKKTVEDLNGEIGFETSRETGTRFWIRIPVRGT